MINKEFEDNLRKDIAGYESPLDVDGFWASIEPTVDEINTKEGQKKWLPYIFIFAVFIGVVSILLCVDFTRKNDVLTIQPNNENSIHVFDEKLSNKEETYHEINKQKYFSDTNVEIGSGFGKKIELTSSMVENKKSISSKVTLLNEVGFEKKQNNKKGEELQNITVKDKETETIENKNTINPIEASEEKNFNQLPIRLFFLKKQDSNFDINIESKTILEIPKRNTFAKNDFVFGLELNGGGGFVNRLLENKDRENKEFLELRNSTETVKGFFQIGLNTKILHRSGFEISSGLHFAQLVERFHFEDEIYVGSPDKNGISHYKVTISGDTIPIYDASVINQQLERHKKRYNNFYRMIDVPIIFGFHKNYQNYSLGIQAGVYLNLRLKTKGLLMNEANEFINLEDQQNVVFKSKVKSSFYIGGVGKYYLNNNWALTVNPNFRFYPKSFTVASNSLSQKYWTMGLIGGVEFLF